MNPSEWLETLTPFLRSSLQNTVTPPECLPHFLVFGLIIEKSQRPGSPIFESSLLQVSFNKHISCWYIKSTNEGSSNSDAKPSTLKESIFSLFFITGFDVCLHMSQVQQVGVCIQLNSKITKTDNTNIRIGERK